MAIFNRKKDKEKNVGVEEANPATGTPAESAPNLDDQMMRRQSAPRPTAESEAESLYGKRQRMMMKGQGRGANGALNGTKALTQPIGKVQVQEAYKTLQKYKEGKANLEQKIVQNEQWYKQRHWEVMRDKSQEVQPTSGWLFNSIANKHADAMDNFPSPNILPREEGDKQEAEILSAIIPVILDQNDFEQTYNDTELDKIKSGTGIYGVYWDSSKLNGLGDIDIRECDILSLFWEPGITDIQKSRNFFSVELRDNDLLIDQYPQLDKKLGGSNIAITKYIYDDTVNTTNKSVVVDWYYKKTNSAGKQILHYCKFVNDQVLFATENDERFAEYGWYNHGLYPFVFDVLYPVKGTPAGFGYIDIAKDAQAWIDRGNQAVLKNMLANASPRYFVREDGEVNEKEFSDLTKELIHVRGNLAQDSIVPIQPNTLNNIYLQLLTNKVDELKEVTGNRDISTGGTTSGVTAASAIAAMQEAGSKLSRDNNKTSYRAYRKIIVMVIELIRQFYDLPRQFRIVGENGAQRYVQYSNANIVPQYQGNDFGMDMGYRLPLFDIEVTAQKQSPYSKMAQNELALQFYSAGFFNPQMADQALACLDMMDFDRKQFIMQKIAQNGGMYQQMLAMQQQMLMLAQMVDQDRGTNLADQMAAGITGGPPVMPIDGSMGAENNEALGGKEGGEPSVTKKARQRVAESTSPT